MIYATFNPETMEVDNIAFSDRSLIPEGSPYIEIDPAIWRKLNGKRKKVVDGTLVEIIDVETELSNYEDAVQLHLDEIAQSRGYDNTYTCLSYLSSTDETWQREANSFNAWRDSVWRKCHEVLNAFKSGKIEAPTVAELIEMLPEINW